MRAESTQRVERKWCKSLMAAYGVLLLLQPLTLRGQETAASILDHTRSAYAALTSYSDTGTVLKEYGPSSHDESHFATYFLRAPRHFLFDYNRASGDRLVVWGDPGAFHVWWKTTAQKTDYPNPGNTNAIVLNDSPTSGAVTKIPPLLYYKADLPNALKGFEPQSTAATDDLAGHKCYRLEGTTSDSYGSTGHKVNARTLTVWIDAGNYLVRKIVEQSSALPGTLNRVTTQFDPQANPQVKDASFQFTPPQ